MTVLVASAWLALVVVLLAMVAMGFEFWDKPRIEQALIRVGAVLMGVVLVLFVIGCVAVAL